MESLNLNRFLFFDNSTSSRDRNVERKLDYTIPVLVPFIILLVLIIIALSILIVIKKIDAYKYQNIPYYWIRYPLCKSDFGDSNQIRIQPVINKKPETTFKNEPQDIRPKTATNVPSPSKDVTRVKAKSLLGRRGSNTSLTINLSNEDGKNTSAKECSSEEYLKTAGNRLSREQLKKSIKFPKHLHSEFCDIPMNYPDKLDVPGSGTKNRYNTILPNNESRVVLCKNSDDALVSYINANYVKGHDGEPKTYIATQGPLPHTVADFWQMVLDVSSPAIVMITKLEEKNKVKCEIYIPEVSEIYGDIRVTLKEVFYKDGFSVRNLVLEQGKNIHNVTHFWFTSWPDHKTPPDPRSLLTMALEVEALRHNCPNNLKAPVVVHCSAGIGRTGCFIAVSIGICQLMELNCVDILGIVCQLRLDRGGMVQTAEQYEFIHHALVMFEQSLQPRLI